MTYVIEGKLICEEKPAKYMNKFVDFQLLEDVRNGSNITKKRYISTTSEKFAHNLNNTGYHLQWNEDLERAIDMCEKRKISISETRIFTPRVGWSKYLTKTFAETKEEITLDGELNLWSETRLPIPWLYVAAFGKLENIFVFDNHKFIIEPRALHKGKKFTSGIVLDTPFFYMGFSSTRTIVQTSRRYR
jgi:hypothetical protein